PHTDGVCTVTGATSTTVHKNGSLTPPYTCAYAAAPSAASGTNTATASWPVSFGSPHSSATGTAAFAFTTPTTIVDGSVSVTDTQGGALGTANSTQANPILFTYSKTQTGVAATRHKYDHSA